MPSLGADMDFGTLIAWHVGVGDQVHRGDIVADVDTDKSVIEVETFVTGTVEELLVPEGRRVPVGTPLALIREDAAPGGNGRGPAVPAAATSPTAAAGPRPAEAGAAQPTAPAPPATVSQTAPAPHHFASPLARRLAHELGVDLAAVTGTGPGGAVRREDVEAYAVSGAPARPPGVAPPEVSRGPLAGTDRQAAVRRAVAAAMARSNREIPHYYLTRDIDVSRAMAWLEAHNAAVGVTDRLLPVVVLLKATALALREAPDLNGTWEQDAFRAASHVHLGVAIALRGGGLVAPALHDADRLSLPELMTRLRDLTARARAGRLRSSEVADPTVTVTSLGDQGPDSVLPVIYPPQVAIVGLGRIRERPWAVDGLLGVRPVVTATLGADHRASDGHRGAVLLAALDRRLQDPENL